jgi:hypothetical protein
VTVKVDVESPKAAKFPHRIEVAYVRIIVGRRPVLCSRGRPMSHGKNQASAPWETPRRKEHASRESYAEITSGRSTYQQGLTATCKD